MFGFGALLTSLQSQVQSTMEETMKTVSEVAAKIPLNMDKLQDDFGDPSGKRAKFDSLDLTYLTPRLIAMGYPSTPSSQIRSRNDAASVSEFFHERHP